AASAPLRPSWIDRVAGAAMGAGPMACGADSGSDMDGTPHQARCLRPLISAHLCAGQPDFVILPSCKAIECSRPSQDEGAIRSVVGHCANLTNQQQESTMKKTITWILIANGAQARVLENTGPGKGLQQVKGLEWAIEPLQAQEIVTDRPGTKGGGGSFNRGGMVPRTDPVEQRETDFVKSVAASLERHQ